MSIDGAIYVTLAADSTTTNLVSTRIYKQRAPQSGSIPYVAFWIVTQDIDQAFSGATGLYTSQIQIDCRSQSYSGAKAISNAVRDALEGLSGTVDNTVIQSLGVERLADIYEPPTTGEDEGIYNSSLELTVWHTET